MQKLVREYLNELKSRQKKRRRTGIAAILLIVLVVGGVVAFFLSAYLHGIRLITVVRMRMSRAFLLPAD